MSKKKAKHIKEGFIKEKTKGKTNEISYSVLEGKRENTAPRDIDPWEIVTQEKKKKSAGLSTRKKRVIIPLLTFVLVILLILLINVGAGLYQKYSGSIDYIQSKEKETLMFIECNNDLNNIMNNLLSADGNTIQSVVSVSDIQNMSTSINNKTEEMNNVRSEIEASVKNIATPKDINVANDCLDAITTELEIIECYKAVIKYAETYIEDRTYAVNAMEYIVSGDEADREATELLMAGNNEAAAQSKEKSQQALEDNTLAKSALLSMSDENSEKFRDYIEFCDYRISAQEAAVAAAQAYIERNKTELETQNSTYNDNQSKATQIAEKWSEKPYETLDSTYYEKRVNDSRRYKELLERLKNDVSKVSSYLG